jgi:hypothetical protein
MSFFFYENIYVLLKHVFLHFNLKIKYYNLKKIYITKMREVSECSGRGWYNGKHPHKKTLKIKKRRGMVSKKVEQ